MSHFPASFPNALHVQKMVYIMVARRPPLALWPNADDNFYRSLMQRKLVFSVGMKQQNVDNTGLFLDILLLIAVVICCY